MKEKTFFNGRWKVIEEIGKGTTGTVYKAVNNRGGVSSYSAIKEILLPKDKKEILNMYSQGATDSDITEYFENKANEWIAKEVNFLEQFKGNPNIVAIEDHDVLERKDMLGRIVVIRMELLETLEDYILTHKVTDKEILKMGLSILNALVDCEEKKVLHRDIKPQNVFVNKNKIFKLGDFSESKEIQETVSNMTQRGTPNYMAPELYKGERGSRSIDTYSLGIMLYQYFNNNKLPFMPEKYKFEDAQKVLEKRMSGEKLPKPKKASEELSRIILKACEYIPEKRYKSAEEFKEDLEEVYNSIKEPVILFNNTDKEEQEKKEEKEENTETEKTVGIFSNTKIKHKRNNDIDDRIKKIIDAENEDEKRIQERLKEKNKIRKKKYDKTVGIFSESKKNTVENNRTIYHRKKDELDNSIRIREEKITNETVKKIEKNHDNIINKEEILKETKLEESNSSSYAWISKSIFPTLIIIVSLFIFIGNDIKTEWDYISLLIACSIPCFTVNYLGDKKNWNIWKRIGVGFLIFMVILFIFVVIGDSNK